MWRVEGANLADVEFMRGGWAGNEMRFETFGTEKSWGESVEEGLKKPGITSYGCGGERERK